MPTKLAAKGLTVPAKATPRRAVKLAPEGIVVAIVAVTGVVDSVADLIVPGAFTHSLSVRRPKVVDDHEWKNKVGRTLHVEEWLPGDRRLPKRAKDGRPWPTEAGALVATMQYNLNAERGREAYEWVRFYAETNEAEFSIGYKATKARKRRDDVRVILQLDLFEFSHVLFGAAPLSMALDVKSMSGASAGTVTKPAFTRVEDTDEDYTDATPPKITAPWDDDDEDPKRAPVESKTAASVLLEAKSLGVGGKSAMETLLEVKAEGGLDKNRGNAEHLRRWFVAGAGGQIPWGSPGDFMACVRVAAEHMSEEQAKGYCNLRHKDALGFYPAEHDTETKSHPMEVKSMSRMKGSYEERIALIEDAARDLFDTILDHDGDDKPYVSAVATYGHEAVVNVWCSGGNGDHTYLLPYTAHDDGTVDLGEPTKVDLELVAVPDQEDADSDEPVAEAVDPDSLVVDPMVAGVRSLLATQSKAADTAASALRDLLESKGYLPAAVEDVTEDDDEDLSEPPPADAEVPAEAVEATEPAAAEEDAVEDDIDSEVTDEPAAEVEDEVEAPAAAVEDEVEAPEDDVEDDLETKVSIDPDEHFSLMDDLGSDD